MGRLGALVRGGARDGTHARDTSKRVDVVPSERHIRVELDGALLADSTSPAALFEPGDGRLITIRQVVERLDERSIEHSGVKDRGFMDSIYFTDPLGMLIELASYRFEPPAKHTHADVLLEAHLLRVDRGDDHIAQIHVADAIENLVTRSQASLSDDRSARHPYSAALADEPHPPSGLVAGE